jgi:hypothetical protein
MVGGHGDGLAGAEELDYDHLRLGIYEAGVIK